MSEALSSVRNFRRVDPKLATSGQPDESQLASAAADGLELVINLALHDDPRYSLANERGAVESLGMDYTHIPVPFGAPNETNLLAFFDAMDARGERNTLVHCAANYRVTAFVGLYRVIRLGWSREDAFALMADVWQPNDVWALFIDEMLGRHGKA